MTIKEAIEIKLRPRGGFINTDNDKEYEADRLSIAALKWRLLMEKDYGSWCGPLLPGETDA